MNPLKVVYAVFVTDDSGLATMCYSHGAQESEAIAVELAKVLNEIETEDHPESDVYYFVREIDVWPIPSRAHSYAKRWEQLELPGDWGHRGPADWSRGE